MWAVFFDTMANNILIHNRFTKLLPNGVYPNSFKIKMFSTDVQNSNSKSHVFFEDHITDDLINLWAIERKELEKLKKEYQFTHLTHSASYFIKACLSKSNDGLYFNKSSNGIELVVIENKNVQLYNYLFGSISTDLLYYVLLYADRYTEGLQIYISDNFDDDTLKLLSTYIKSFQTTSFPETMVIEIDKNKDYTILKCES